MLTCSTACHDNYFSANATEISHEPTAWETCGNTSSHGPWTRCPASTVALQSCGDGQELICRTLVVACALYMRRKGGMTVTTGRLVDAPVVCSDSRWKSSPPSTNPFQQGENPTEVFCSIPATAITLCLGWRNVLAVRSGRLARPAAMWVTAPGKRPLRRPACCSAVVTH
jgi:hypothetical protein